jgi:hypothetical protein
MFVRDVSLRIKQTKDGVAQYARIVTHVEIPNDEVYDEIVDLGRKQKGSFVAELSEEQPDLPLKVGMSG